MILLGIIIFLILLFSYLWKLGKKPYKSRRKCSDDLGEFFKLFLSNGRNGAHLFIDIPSIDGFIQFVKLDSQKLQSHFPDAPWSRPYFEKAVKCTKELGLSYVVESTGLTDTTRFLIINFDDDLDVAQLFVKSIFNNAFSLSEDDSIVLWFENVDVIIKK